MTVASALSAPNFDGDNEPARRRLPRKLLPRNVRVREMTLDGDTDEIDVPKQLLARVAVRPRFNFIDGRPAAVNHILLGLLLAGTKKLFRLSSPGGGLVCMKNDLPVRVTTAAQLAVILADELLFEFINKKGEPAC
jgi:hypothetical protein